MAKTVLVVEDEETLQKALNYNLAQEKYQVLVAGDGEEGIRLARQHSPDLVILDLLLPDMDGFEVCRILRKEMAMPIIILTAKGEEVDKVVGLELGADDYVTKPFSMRELLARVKAQLRRAEAQPPVPSPLRAGDLEIDLAAHRAFLKGAPLELASKEFDLIAFLVRHRGRAFTREQLLKEVWGYDYLGDSRTVDVHVRWLREKIEPDPAKPRYLLTIRGMGYRFEG